MMLWLIVGLLICGAFGIPYIPLLVFGAFAMCAMAYYLTRDIRIRTCAVSLGLVVGSHVLFFLLESQLETIEPHSPARDFMKSDLVLAIGDLIKSDWVLAGAAIVAIIFACGVGMFGPIGKSNPPSND